MLAEPGVRAVNCRGHTARIRAGAIRIQLGSDQLRRHRVSHVRAGGLLHDGDRVRLSIDDATDFDRLHAPGFGMILPVALSSNLTIASGRCTRTATRLTAISCCTDVTVVTRSAVRFRRV